EVFSRTGDAGPWTRHASGELGMARPASHRGGPLGTWPPADATPVDVDRVYASLARAGQRHRPAFRRLPAASTRGEEIFAEVALDEQTEARGYGIHPALLDAALHAVAGHAVQASTGGAAGEPRLPFAWQGLTLHASGATELRVRIEATGSGTLAVECFD